MRGITGIPWYYRVRRKMIESERLDIMMKIITSHFLTMVGLRGKHRVVAINHSMHFTGGYNLSILFSVVPWLCSFAKPIGHSKTVGEILTWKMSICRGHVAPGWRNPSSDGPFVKRRGVCFLSNIQSLLRDFVLWWYFILSFFFCSSPLYYWLIINGNYCLSSASDPFTFPLSNVSPRTSTMWLRLSAKIFAFSTLYCYLLNVIKSQLRESLFSPFGSWKPPIISWM